MKKLLIVLLVLTVPFISRSQQVNGIVSDTNGAPLRATTVAWLSGEGTVTDENGRFRIALPESIPGYLVISHSGFASDTLKVSDTTYIIHKLLAVPALSEVTILSQKQAHYISINPIKTEIISSLELKKAACCDLAGCFETQASVQPQTTNIITNSKELRILGLSGIYNQVLVDGFPLIQGLTYTYGISSIPGVLVDNIWIAKGANSVLQGYESISGQINVITKEPDKADKLLLNVYMNSFGEKHLNAIASYKNKKWSNVTAFHMVQPASKTDKDNDTFLDLPLLNRYMISSRWKKGDESKWGWSTQASIKYLSERRIGGQTSFIYKKDKGSTNAYGQAVDINQPEGWFKMAYRMNDQHRFALYTSGFYQQQQAYFGVTNYKAIQTNGYANLQYERGYANNSSLKTGFSFRYITLKEDISFSENSLNRTYDGSYKNTERIPGIFAENILNIGTDKLTWIAGIRADHHNRFGWNVTPRTMLKYQVADNLILRASIGTGWRTAHIFPENIGLLASSRDIIFAESLLPEKALNFGFNATRKYKKGNMDGYISIDLYRTSFSNQIFPDYETDVSKAIIRNFTGNSESTGFQAEISNTFHNKFAIKLAYVYLDVFQERSGGKELLPFNSKHRFNSAGSYMPSSKKWHFDANLHWYGSQELPSTKDNPIIYQLPESSDAYTILNMQFTYKFKQFDIYGGAENVFNFRQNKPLIGWQDPFGQYFDTQFAWGPTRGRELYGGVRFYLK